MGGRVAGSDIDGREGGVTVMAVTVMAEVSAGGERRRAVQFV